MANTSASKKLDNLVAAERAAQIASLSDIDQRLLELKSDARVALLRKENAQLRERLRNRDTGFEIVKAAFEQAYMEPLEIVVERPPKQQHRDSSEEAVGHLTDIHFGKETSTYNSIVAAERVRLAFRKMAEIITLRREFAEIDRMALLLGGDNCEGEGEIFPGQAHEIDQGLIEQMVKFGPEVLASGILFLLQVVHHIEIHGAPGNHGKQGRNSSKRNNADSIFYEIVRLLVEKSNPAAASRVTWNLPLDRKPGEEWYASFTVSKRWGGLLVHGDQIRGQLGFPWYGYGKKVAGWASCLPRFDYLWGGHFHTHAGFDLHGRHVFSTGSPESDNSYAKENMAASGSPKQRISFFNERYGLLADNPLHLEDREPMA